MHLVCVNCGGLLTKECRLGAATDHNRLASMREAAVPAGIIVLQAGAFSVNPADIRTGALKSVGIDVGCCGSDGCDGSNRACVCGAVVGTEWSDCWTQSEVQFDADAVRCVPNP
jgi:hypothetical protein